MEESVFSNFNVGDGLNLRNRVVLSPLDMTFSRSDGQVTQRDIEFHRSRSRDVGLDIVGSTFVSPEGNTAAKSIGACSDEMIPGLSKVSDVIHQNGARAILQVVHAGRATTSDVTFGRTVVGPSAIAAPFGRFPIPKELNEREISKVMNRFIDAVIRAEKAGFDGVELHGANSFLLQQFVSPVSNKREDKFGGNLIRRLRFPVELVSRIQSLIRSFDRPFALGYRLSPDEQISGGMSLVDTVSLAKVLDACGITYLSLSLRKFDQPGLLMKNTSAEKVVPVFKKNVTCPVIIAGGVSSLNTLKEAGELADLVGVGTALIKDPHWVKKVRNELDGDYAENPRYI